MNPITKIATITNLVCEIVDMDKNIDCLNVELNFLIAHLTNYKKTCAECITKAPVNPTPDETNDDDEDVYQCTSCAKTHSIHRVAKCEKQDICCECILGADECFTCDCRVCVYNIEKANLCPCENCDGDFNGYGEYSTKFTLAELKEKDWIHTLLVPLKERKNGELWCSDCINELDDSDDDDSDDE